MSDLSDFFICDCEPKYTIEPHGDEYVLYYGRCNHKHGLNLVYLKEPAHNCDLTHIEKLINIGHNYNKGIKE